MRMTWDEVLAGYECGKIALGAHFDGALINVTVNDNKIFEGTQSDAYVTFIALSKLFGKRTSKQLLKMKQKNESFVRNA